MSSIEQDIAQVRNAVYGREVREAIADGLEKLASGSSGPQNIKDGTGTKAVIEGELDGDNANVASGSHSHAEGYGVKATGVRAHAEGYRTTSGGSGSHTEGHNTTATGQGAHAEGASTTASGPAAHAEGGQTTASGGRAHAEGTQTVASGSYCHAEGENTVANHKAQHVFGRFNIPDDSELAEFRLGNYVEIVGNGDVSTTEGIVRSNARTLDWYGNEKLAGSLTLGMGTTDEVTVTAAQLKQLLAMLN